jgi:hypothetical protein
MTNVGTARNIEAEIAELRERLVESESVLKAIRRGEIDAIVVSGAGEERVFTLEGAEHPYRVFPRKH